MFLPRWLFTVVLLIASNTFMTFAWYYHLRKDWPIYQAIMFSWLLAFFEYCLQVPANKYGHTSNDGPFTAPQLKVIQECISLCVFAAFSVFVLKERLRSRDVVAFGLIFLGVLVAMTGKAGAQQTQHEGQNRLHGNTLTIEEAELLPLTATACAPLWLSIDVAPPRDLAIKGAGVPHLGEQLPAYEQQPLTEGPQSLSAVLTQSPAAHQEVLSHDDGDAIPSADCHETLQLHQQPSPSPRSGSQAGGVLPSAVSFQLPDGQGVAEDDVHVVSDALHLSHRHRGSALDDVT